MLIKTITATLTAAFFIASPTTVSEPRTSFVIYDEAHIYPQPITGFDRNEINCLAQNIYHEARGERVKDQRAVSHVVYNRVKSEKFPNTFCGVITQGGERRYKCQFTWFCDGRPDTIAEIQVWNDIYKRAEKFYTKRHFLLDITRGSLYYHTTNVQPYWAAHFELTGQHGAHLFYAAN